MRYFFAGVLLAALCFWYTISYAETCPFDFVHTYAANANGTHTSWVSQCSDDPRDGGGTFYQILSANKAGNLVVATILNQGLITATPGAEQMDWELYGPHNGVTVDKDGYGYGIVMDGLDNAFFAPQHGVVSLGMINHAWAALYVLSVPCPPNVPWGASSCIKVNDGYVPIYQDAPKVFSNKGDLK